ncbi:DUF4173 domain-containing protein [Mesorhizobium sp.]|uniref:DUF4153 domain-containing protein n=1 Tax=Mesorhizobium sp. TaxID=1871066 RepID=UPI000FE3F58B|nr:DUF4173 domain-containing protein [Mesorhizobium sp.]RWA65296.1 MAG: DUF4173 domain-containing protein [Mesorhizobium sp.]RWB95746.1 MAG: DUF4173 domain-containing protein [Mesorhizobium sp.]RWG78053.1 MAG: DUF4173 domain-containing protein [Mesorhizobium sp.]RWG81429.1 MAG: DUF4173 domain-containing protein [Mesorhizobium sp.]RWJ98877.1 MAG: DUF4173 domain-containing protein [Mesorhizobium sp.]
MTTMPIAPSYCRRIGAGILLVALTDFLFYGQPAGISVFLFGMVLAGAVVAMHPAALSDGRVWPGPAALFAGLLPLIENVSPLSVLIAVLALAVFALSLARRLRAGIARVAGQLGLFLIAAPFRFVRDFFRWRKVARRLGRRRIRLAAIAVWAMPLTLGAVFLALFGVANPIIEHWLSLIDLYALLERIEVGRLVFWLIVLAGVWAFLRPRLPRIPSRIKRVAPAARAARPARTSTEDIIFGKAAILRALIVFNALFSVQTLLDVTYLWGGAALPDGLTYAAYAHRGAYPLVVTALLAAGFVLAALRPDSETSHDPLIRRLVYLWVAQNIALVISSMLRLDLYVGVYALTYLRVAAFVWMGLVAAGLAFIVARIALTKSGEWLLSANLLTLSATLYACCFVNFAALIANYNVDHSREMTGQGVPLDGWYLRDLGPCAFPALDRFLAYLGGTTASDHPLRHDLPDLRRQDEIHWRAEQKNWRAWSFRDWRLARYLDKSGPLVVPQPAEPSMPGR